jgi:microcystin-dependent protein
MTSPIDASVMGSVGGEQAHTLITSETPAHVHSITDPGHFHTINGSRPLNVGSPIGQAPFSAGNPQCGNLAISIDTNTTGITGTNSTGGGGSHNNVQPGIVSFLPLIKT